MAKHIFPNDLLFMYLLSWGPDVTLWIQRENYHNSILNELVDVRTIKISSVGVETRNRWV